MEDEITKVAKLRNNEYYFMQDLLDLLYKRSKLNYNFYNLIPYIISEENLKLAYRNIKTNKGSKTNGLSGRNITLIENMKLSYYLKEIKVRILNYEPSLIKRVGIPKANGKTRYLGIKEPIDKIIEQAIYQVLEPILTAKFHNNSNGFISGRSCQRAIAQFNNYVINNKLYYVIDLDIKSFFDNVNHGKLLKQLWTAGIRDKNLLILISKMLKAEIHEVGKPEKGTPQGGILSPLLANLVLNELDWWLDEKKKLGIRFVRYADDVRVLCPTYLIARNMLEKIINWLNERLKLEVSEEKTKIVNLQKNYTEFLGCKIKITKNERGKYKISSSMSDKAIDKCQNEMKKRLRNIKKQKLSVKKCNKLIDNLNSYIMGVHNYYEMNTKINGNLNFINYLQMKYIFKNLRNVLTFKVDEGNHNFITTKYGNEQKLPYIRGKPLIPIGRIIHNPPKAKSEENVNFFLQSSRKKFHKELGIHNMFVLLNIIKDPLLNETVELNDIIVSRFCGQLGKYSITNKTIFNKDNVNFIRINNKIGNKYDNILIVENKVKKLVELKEVDDMVVVSELKRGLNYKQLEKINEIRKENSLSII